MIKFRSTMTIILLILISTGGCAYVSGTDGFEVDELMDCCKSDKKRTSMFIEYILDDLCGTDRPNLKIRFWGNSYSDAELTGSYGRLMNPVYEKLHSMIAETDDRRDVIVIEIFENPPSTTPPDVVIVLFLEKPIEALGDVGFWGMVISMETKDYFMGYGGMWNY